MLRLSKHGDPKGLFCLLDSPEFTGEVVKAPELFRELTSAVSGWLPIKKSDVLRASLFEQHHPSNLVPE